MLSGALVVGFSLVPGMSALAQEVIADESAAVHISKETEALSGSLKTNPLLDAWIKIASTGEVTVFTGKVELGTGVRTALLQVVVEELNMAPSLITFLTADTGLSLDEGLTAGSHTIADSGTALLNSAAQVCALLVGAAAQRLGVDSAKLETRDAKIIAPDGHVVTYGEAVQSVDLHRDATPTSPLKDPHTFKVIGTSMPRLDIPGKLTGAVSYVQDHMPNMVHARVVLPHAYDAALLESNEAEVMKMSGVVKVVRNGNFLAVVAKGEWQAVVAQRALSSGSRWSAGRPLPNPGTVHRDLKTIATQHIEIANTHAPAAPAVTTLSASYIKSYLMHGSIGPSCSVALPGQPVRVQWMRDQEHTWDHFTPAMITEVSASLDVQGRIVDWNYALWSSSHNERIVNAGRLTPATQLAKPFVSAPSTPMLHPEGGGDRNAIPLYALPNVHVMNNFSPTMPLRTSAMRSLGAHTNVFAIESFMDELAFAAHTDPVEFRLKHLQDPRAQDVIRLAAKEFGWPLPPRQANNGVGFAFGKYKNLMAYVAIALELSVELETGQVRVEHAVAAVDSERTDRQSRRYP
ncbi:MAG: Uncharacterized aldehyde oxidase, molybdopterin-binding subunit [uncultured Caballeronia sp.]|nr:MAG: Uncharacterized aldehyde oxidase, molybdopterin-binding subunit [uncultured Caballeronia sp.]